MIDDEGDEMGDFEGVEDDNMSQSGARAQSQDESGDDDDYNEAYQPIPRFDAKQSQLDDDSDEDDEGGEVVGDDPRASHEAEDEVEDADADPDDDDNDDDGDDDIDNQPRSQKHAPSQGKYLH